MLTVYSRSSCSRESNRSVQREQALFLGEHLSKDQVKSETKVSFAVEVHLDAIRRRCFDDGVLGDVVFGGDIATDRSGGVA
jgi:hypothetical protein